MQADCQEMASLFERKRLTFGAWRYFERNAGDGGIKALVDITAARDLGRAARVPPAEAEDLHYRQQHSAHRAETHNKQPA